MKEAINKLQEQNPIILGCLEQNKIAKTSFDNCSKYDTFIDFPPNAVLHHKRRVVQMGGYNSDEYPMADTFFFSRAYNQGNIFIVQQCLQKKRSEISEYFQPNTLLAYCFIGSAFLLQQYKPKWYGRYQAYFYIQSYRLLLCKFPIIASFIDTDLINKYNICKPSISRKLLRKIHFWFLKKVRK